MHKIETVVLLEWEKKISKRNEQKIMVEKNFGSYNLKGWFLVLEHRWSFNFLPKISKKWVSDYTIIRVNHENNSQLMEGGRQDIATVNKLEAQRKDKKEKKKKKSMDANWM